MNLTVFLPTEKVFLPELDVFGTVVGVYISIGGTEYKVRYFKDQIAYECFFYDFEVKNDRS